MYKSLSLYLGITVKPKPQNNYVPSNPVEIETGSNLKKAAEQGGTESTPSNSFGIYLSAEPVDRRVTGYGNGDRSRIRLVDLPRRSPRSRSRRAWRPGDQGGIECVAQTKMANSESQVLNQSPARRRLHQEMMMSDQLKAE